MSTNERLAALLATAGFVDHTGAIARKRFARAVTAAAGALGTERTYTHTYVGRWLGGVVPRDNLTRDAIRNALGASLGRVVERDELGFRSGEVTSPDVGLAYPDRPEDGVTAVAQLLDADLARSPVVELPTPGSNAGKIYGRDHNHHGFTMWLAGGGVKGGQVYGATDEFGFAAVENKVHVHDLHATILKLLGFDHTRLTYRYAGRDFRLTDVEGNVVQALIA